MKGTVAFDDVYCDRETELAIHVEVDGKWKWIPKSVVDDDSEVYGMGHEGELVLAEWFALKEGLI